ncbi:MAG: hypothetical protein KAI24_09965, partial [Planctomycetes bacterium]|nr:hypothetical protein [Planctomycetota bacterium]
MQTVRRPSAARLYLFLFAVALPLACAGAQQVRQAPPAVLNLFDVAAGTLQSLTVVGDGSGDLVVPVVIGGARRSMVLSLHDVRAPDFQLFERTAAGLVPLPTPPCVTYRGHLAEEPSARVAATVIDGTVEAMIYRASTAAGVAPETWVVQPLRRVRPGASAALHVVFRATDTNPLPYQCGTDTSAVTPSTSTAMPDSTSICEIAIEADRQFWQWHNNNTVQTQNDVTNVMNQVDFIFDRDCDVTFVITSLIVTTTTVYTTNDSSALLNQFANFWTANNGAIHRDVAHLFTGRNLTGSTIGVAYLSTVCSQSNGYGLSQSDFTSNFNSRVGLTCHELGHNFSAPHCNGNNPCYIMCSGLGV